MFISFLQTRSDYRIRLNGDWDMDIPKGYHQLKQYCATLAHKANHSFTPNVEWGIFEHPRFGLIRSLRAIRDLKKGDEVWGWMLKDFTTKPHFPSCWSTTTWQWRSLRSGTARYVWPQCSNSIVLLRFGCSGCGRQRKMTQQSKGSDSYMYKYSKGSCCQVHRPSVRAARLSDPLTWVWGALCPRAWGSRPGNRAGGVLDRGGSERGGGPLVFSGSGRSQGGAGGENTKSKSEIWRDNRLRKMNSIECWRTKKIFKYPLFHVKSPLHLELTCNICVIREQILVEENIYRAEDTDRRPV